MSDHAKLDSMFNITCDTCKETHPVDKWQTLDESGTAFRYRCPNCSKALKYAKPPPGFTESRSDVLKDQPIAQ